MYFHHVNTISDSFDEIGIHSITFDKLRDINKNCWKTNEIDDNQIIDDILSVGAVF